MLSLIVLFIHPPVTEKCLISLILLNISKLELYCVSKMVMKVRRFLLKKRIKIQIIFLRFLYRIGTTKSCLSVIIHISSFFYYKSFNRTNKNIPTPHPNKTKLTL